MKKYLCVLFILFSQTAFCQDSLKTIDKSYEQNIDKNILRLILTFPLSPDYEETTISLSYERQMHRSFTILASAGPGFHLRKFGPENQRYQLTINAFAAVEFRYYFLFLHRLKRERSVLNFSGPYFSLAQNIFSNPIALLNQPKNEAFQGSTYTSFNLGYHKQYRKFYMNAFFGVNIFSINLSKDYPNEQLAKIRGGLQIGMVF